MADRISDLKMRVEVECNRKGISRAELARRIGMSPPQFYEMVSRGNMKATVLHDMAQELEVPMEILMTPVDDDEFVEAKRQKRILMRQNRQSDTHA